MPKLKQKKSCQKIDIVHFTISKKRFIKKTKNNKNKKIKIEVLHVSSGFYILYKKNEKKGIIKKKKKKEIIIIIIIYIYNNVYNKMLNKLTNA